MITDSYPVVTDEIWEDFNARKGAWEGGRNCDDWQITKTRWRRILEPKIVRSKKGHQIGLF